MGVKKQVTEQWYKLISFLEGKNILVIDIYTENKHKSKYATIVLKDYLNPCIEQLLSTSYVLASMLCIGDTVTNYPHKIAVLVKRM